MAGGCEWWWASRHDHWDGAVMREEVTDGIGDGEKL